MEEWLALSLLIYKLAIFDGSWRSPSESRIGR